MGELVASAAPAEELVSLGIGSCVAVALVDGTGAVAALAHVMLPGADAAPSRASAPAAKFADAAVPALLDAVQQLGADRPRLDAVLVGGAQMFGGGLGVGARNVAAIRAALASERVPVRAVAIGGDRGRSVRVRVGDARVTVKEAAGAEVELWRAA